jgi:hypothetical protein
MVFIVFYRKLKIFLANEKTTEAADRAASAGISAII